MNLQINEISLYISFLSFLISLATFIYNYSINKFHLKIKIKPSKIYVKDKDENDEYNYSIDCNLENKSKYPITIIKATMNGYNAFDQITPIKGNGYTKFSKDFENVWYTLGFPLILEPFDAKKGILMFCSNSSIKLRKINILKIYTTRGRKFIFFKYPLKLSNNQ